MSNQGESADRASVGQWIARGVAVAILVPVRLLWEALKLLGRTTVAALVFLLERLLTPLGSLVRHWVIRPAWHLLKDFVWDWLLHQVLWGLILTPVLAFLLDFVLRPLRRAIEEWLWRRVLVPAALTLWRHVLVPVATQLWRWVLRPVARVVVGVVALLLEWLVARPIVALWRWVLAPLLRVSRVTLRFGWRMATRVVTVLVVIPCVYVYRTVLRPVSSALGTVWNALVTRPARWVHRGVVVPMNRWASELVGSVFGR